MSWHPLTVLFAILVAGWLLAYLILTIRTRSPAVPPAPASPELGPEPPAIVNLLANRWRLNADAAEATLLDLAARGFLELQQVGADPVTTTIQLRQTDADQLLPYERRVLERVRQLAVDGVVPVTALTFRDRRRADAWERQLRKEIVADARARGLSRSRFSTSAQAALSTAAGVSAFVPALFLVLQNRVEAPALVAGVVIMVALAAAVTKLTQSERDTPAGRSAAARWLGVRDWLRGHEEFAELPPASVTVWDRYLAHGAALGVTRTTSAVLDLGMGDDRLVWSSHGGHWRRVRIRYPRLRAHYGKSVPGLLVQTVAMCGAAAILTLLGSIFSGLRTDFDVPAPARLAGWAALTVAALLVLYSLYAVVRGLVDLAQVRTVAGEVLWVKVARVHSSKGSRKGRPYLYHLAIDDGGSDTTTAWGIPPRGASELHPGDIVRVQVRPWSRRVLSHQLVRPGPRRDAVPAQQEHPEPVPQAPAHPPRQPGPPQPGPEQSRPYPQPGPPQAQPYPQPGPPQALR